MATITVYEVTKAAVCKPDDQSWDELEGSRVVPDDIGRARSRKPPSFIFRFVDCSIDRLIGAFEGWVIVSGFGFDFET